LKPKRCRRASICETVKINLMGKREVLLLTFQLLSY